MGLLSSECANDMQKGMSLVFIGQISIQPLQKCRFVDECERAKRMNVVEIFINKYSDPSWRGKIGQRQPRALSVELEKAKNNSPTYQSRGDESTSSLSAAANGCCEGDRVSKDARALV